jgi:hypothetical protein
MQLEDPGKPARPPLKSTGMSTARETEDSEGVVKYHLEFRPAPAMPWSLIENLEGWRRLLFRLGLVGRDPYRYDGLAYGNVSRRDPGGGFLISGTQTGALEQLTAEHYCRVTAADAAANRLAAEGPIPPSSEALTHAAVYAARSEAECVLHVHCPELWEAAEALAIRATGRDIPYGTPAMAAAVEALLAYPDTRVIAMGGHRDGLIAFGATPEDAALPLLRLLARSL